MINYHPNWFNSITFDNGAEFSTLAKIRERNLKKINDPVRNLKGRKKTQIVDQIRVEQETLPKSNRYKVGDILWSPVNKIDNLNRDFFALCHD